MNEIYTEWGRFCLRCRQVTETSEFSSAPVDLPQFDGATEFRIAANFSGGKLMIGTLFFVPYYEVDPLPITFHYDEAVASLREGYCLLVPIADTDWSEAVWPKTMAELDGYIANSTGYPRLHKDWILGRRRALHKLLMVLLVKDDNCYGYLIGSPKDGDFRVSLVISETAI